MSPELIFGPNGVKEGRGLPILAEALCRSAHPEQIQRFRAVERREMDRWLWQEVASEEVVPDNGPILCRLLATPCAALGPSWTRSWLASATAIALPMVLLVARIRSLMGGRDLAAGLEYLFGRWPSRAVALGYGVLTWRLSCYVMSDVTNFVQAVALPTTPQFVVASVLALLMLWAAKEGVEVIARFSVVMAKVVLLVLAVTFLLMLSEVDIGEFLPVMYDGPKPVIMGALQLLDFPFLEVIVLLDLDCFQSKNSPYKVFLPVS